MCVHVCLFAVRGEYRTRKNTASSLDDGVKGGGVFFVGHGCRESICIACCARQQQELQPVTPASGPAAAGSRVRESSSSDFRQDTRAAGTATAAASHSISF